MTRSILILLALALVSCVGPSPRPERVRSPADVIAQPVHGERVSWVGRVKSFEARRQDSKVVLEWVCSYLSTPDRLSEELGTTPIAVTGKGSGLFLVNLISDAPEERIAELGAQSTKSPHYMWASGSVDSVVERKGKRVVFLFTERMRLGHDLVLFSKR